MTNKKSNVLWALPDRIVLPEGPKDIPLFGRKKLVLELAEKLSKADEEVRSTWDFLCAFEGNLKYMAPAFRYRAINDKYKLKFERASYLEDKDVIKLPDCPVPSRDNSYWYFDLQAGLNFGNRKRYLIYTHDRIKGSVSDKVRDLEARLEFLDEASNDELSSSLNSTIKAATLVTVARNSEELEARYKPLKGLISENKDGKTALNFAHRSVELLFDSWPLSREHKSHEEYDAYRKLVKTKVEFLGDFYRFINGLDASYSLDVTVGDLALEMVLLRGDGRDETSFKKHLHRIVTKDPLLKSCNPGSVKLVRSILSRPRGERLSYVSDQEPPPLGSDVEADLTVLDTIYRYKTGSGDILSNLKLFGNGFRKAVELNPSLTTALAGALEEVRDRVKKDTILRIDSSLGLPLETPSVKPITVDPTIKEASELYRMIDDLVKAKDHKRLNTVVRDLARTVSESGDLKPYMDIFDTFYLASQAEGLIGRGQYNVAVGMADLVIRFEPSNPQAHYVVGKVNYRLGRDQHKKGKIDTARKYFDKATKEYLSALVYDKTETALLELKEALENLS